MIIPLGTDLENCHFEVDCKSGGLCHVVSSTLQRD